MQLVVDANVLISALMADSTIRAVITTTEDDLYTPEYAFREVERHKPSLMERSGLAEQEFDRLVSMLREHVEVIPRGWLLGDLHEAARIMRDIDPDDAMFLAGSLSYGGIPIISNDPHLTEEQTEVEARSMTEFVERTLGTGGEDHGEWSR